MSDLKKWRKWNKQYKGFVSFDFDGVLAKYNGWKGFDILGEPIKEVIKVVQKLYKEKYYIIIWTGRQDTPTLRKWLQDNNIPYHTINNPKHNPPVASAMKPYFQAVIDDRAINPVDLCTGEIKSAKKIYKQIVKIVKKAKGKLEDKREKVD